MAACPLPAVRRLAWLPLFLDPGCVFGLLYSCVMLIYHTIAAARGPAEETTPTDEPQ